MTFEEVFSEYKKMRVKIRKPMTEFAEKLVRERLKKMSDDENIRIEILKQSIEKSWQGVFPLRNYYVVSNQFSKEVESKARDYHANTGRMASEELKQKWEEKLRSGQNIY